MNDHALYDSTVPVFKHYLLRTEKLLQGLPEEAHSSLSKSLAVHAFSAAEHFETAIAFVSRTVHPLLGEEVIDSHEEALDIGKLLQMANYTYSWLTELNHSDFKGASKRIIHHKAGDAELEHDAITFVTMLRKERVDIGKSDFDGMHIYKPGFHF